MFTDSRIARCLRDAIAIPRQHLLLAEGDMGTGRAGSAWLHDASLDLCEVAFHPPTKQSLFDSIRMVFHPAATRFQNSGPHEHHDLV